MSNGVKPKDSSTSFKTNTSPVPHSKQHAKRRSIELTRWTELEIGTDLGHLGDEVERRHQQLLRRLAHSPGKRKGRNGIGLIRQQVDE